MNKSVDVVKKASYNLVLKSNNGVGTYNNNKSYFFDTNKLKNCPYEVSFSFNSEGNPINPLNQALVSVNLGQSKTFNVGDVNNTNSRVIGSLYPRSINSGGYIITGIEPLYTISATTATTNEITINTASTSDLYIGMSIVIAGTPFGGLATGTFIVETITSSTTFTLVGITGLTTAIGSMTFQNSLVNNIILNSNKGLKVGFLVSYTVGANSAGLATGIYRINSILGSTTILLDNSGNLGTGSGMRLNLQVLNINSISADYSTNPPIYIDDKPSNNTLEVKIVDEYDTPWLDGIDADISNYTLILHFQEL